MHASEISKKIKPKQCDSLMKKFFQTAERSAIIGGKIPETPARKVIFSLVADVAFFEYAKSISLLRVKSDLMKNGIISSTKLIR